MIYSRFLLFFEAKNLNKLYFCLEKCEIIVYNSGVVFLMGDFQ